MRRLWVVLLLLMPAGAWAQNGAYIQYYPTSLTALGSGVFAMPGSALCLYNVGTPGATDYERGCISWVGNQFKVVTEAGGTGSTRSVVLDSNNNVVLADSIGSSSSDTQFLGQTTNFWQHVYLSRSLQGSKSKALTDNTKAAFVKVAVAAGSYGGGDLVYTLYCADAADRVSRSGRLPFAFQNTSNTESCAVGTATSSGDVTNNAKSFAAVTFTCADGGTDTIQLEVQADCSIASPTTLNIEYRLDMPKVNTVTPQ